MSDELPQATRESIMKFCGIPLRVYQLDDGRRVIHADDIHKVVDALEAGARPSPEDWFVAQAIANPHTPRQG